VTRICSWIRSTRLHLAPQRRVEIAGGSSSNSTSGRSQGARKCCALLMPPESLRRYLSVAVSSCTMRSDSLTVSGIASRPTPRALRRGDVLERRSYAGRAPGFEKPCEPPRLRRQVFASRSRGRICPVGRQESGDQIERGRFPQPEGPSSVRNSPAAILRSRPSRTACFFESLGHAPQFDGPIRRRSVGRPIRVACCDS